MHPCRYLVAAGAVLALAGCAVPPQVQRPAGKVAYVTSGDTYFYGATRFGQDVSVIEVDGKPVAPPADPIELQPGTHSLRMKCGENVSTHTLNVRAGDIYQYLVRPAPGGKGCAAALSRVRSSY